MPCAFLFALSIADVRKEVKRKTEGLERLVALLAYAYKRRLVYNFERDEKTESVRCETTNSVLTKDAALEPINLLPINSLRGIGGKARYVAKIVAVARDDRRVNQREDGDAKDKLGEFACAAPFVKSETPNRRENNN